MSGYQLIAALGSSFAAGPGIEPVADAPAMRSANNYAHQLAERLGAALVDLTVSGATTANIIDTPQQLMTGGIIGPQLDALPAGADIVTVTAGGNDLQFAGAMLYTAWLHRDPQGPLATMLRPQFPVGIPPVTEPDLARATQGLVDVVEAARRKAVHARVILVDYLTVLEPGTSTSATTPFTGAELADLLPIQAAVKRAFAEAAGRTGAELLLASELSAGHALGANESWIQPFHDSMDTTAGSFHPNLAGMTAIAQALAELLQG